MHPARRPALAPCLTLLAGAAVGEAVPCAPRSIWIGVLILVAGMAALRRRRRCARAALLAAAGLTGLALASVEGIERMARTVAWIPDRAGGWEGEVTGRVLRAPEREADGTRVVLVEGSPAVGRIPRCTLLLRVRVGATSSGSHLDALRHGDRIRAWCRLRRPLPLGNPGASDPDLSLRARGIDLAGTVKTPRLLVAEARGRFGLGRAVDEGAVRLARRLDRALGPGDARGLVGAMLLGERGSLSPEALRALRESGTFHVLSVSGLHVALLLGACLFPLRALRLRRAGGLLLVLLAGIVLGALVA
ncbi:MAG TPA: ComEC/Rec2 family competence protein, partial [Candidatus Polarisedimenticolaceae bacterium]|nr:ComEC/Rec2 family competence protein [Candidatus Polarisedimenticolaceae bacterium]